MFGVDNAGNIFMVCGICFLAAIFYAGFYVGENEGVRKHFEGKVKCERFELTGEIECVETEE